MMKEHQIRKLLAIEMDRAANLKSLLRIKYAQRLTGETINKDSERIEQSLATNLGVDLGVLTHSDTDALLILATGIAVGLECVLAEVKDMNQESVVQKQVIRKIHELHLKLLRQRGY